MTPAPEVIVVGAGPAGCAAAIRLARRGHRVALLDRSRFPRDKACSEYLSPGTLRHLDALGVLPALDEAGGVQLRGTHVVAPGGSHLTGLFAKAGHSPFRPTGMAIPRRILDAALVDQARRAGVEVREGTAVVDLVYESGRVGGVVIRQGDRHAVLRSRLVIGADGLRSVVARRIGTVRLGRPRRMALVAHLAGVAGLADLAELHVSDRGYAGLNPLGQGVANVAVVLPSAEIEAARGRVEAFFHASLDRFPGVRGRVPPGPLVRGVMVTGPFASWSADAAVGGALLAGDAADFFDPFTGEGIGAALRGGQLAAEAAAGGLAEPGPVTSARLAGYRAARREAFAGKWALERLIAWAMLTPRLFTRAVDRLERHGLAHTLIGVTGDFVPPAAVLNPRFLATMVL